MRQAEFLGHLIESLQLANGAEPVIAVGDFNAFEFSDGYIDVIGGRFFSQPRSRRQQRLVDNWCRRAEEALKSDR